MVFETILYGVEILRIEYPVKEYEVVGYLRKVLDFLATLFLRTVFSYHFLHLFLQQVKTALVINLLMTLLE